MDAPEFEKVLESIKGIGALSVTKNGDCANFDMVTTFVSLPGDLPEMTVHAFLFFFAIFMNGFSNMSVFIRMAFFIGVYIYIDWWGYIRMYMNIKITLLTLLFHID